MYPKVYYFTYFENMRKRKYEKITTPSVVMKFFKDLKPKEPEIFTATMDIQDTLKKIKHDHLILGLFPNGKSETYKNEFITIANKFSHLPVYACFDIQNITYQLNLTQSRDTVMIIRKPELRPPEVPEFIMWDHNGTLMDFIENNYHLDVDIYTHDSKYLYDLHSDDVGIIYFAGANTLYHQGKDSPVSKLIQVLNNIHKNLSESKSDFKTPESIARYSRFKLALAFKDEFWIWSRKLHLKMEMDYTEEFSPIVLDSDHIFYMNKTLANMTLDTLDEVAIYQFYYDYIQGSIKEFKYTEPIFESYVVGDHWKRRLDQSTNGIALSQQLQTVGKLTPN